MAIFLIGAAAVVQGGAPQWRAAPPVWRRASLAAGSLALLLIALGARVPD